MTAAASRVAVSVAPYSDSRPAYAQRPHLDPPSKHHQGTFCSCLEQLGESQHHQRAISQCSALQHKKPHQLGAGRGVLKLWVHDADFPDFIQQLSCRHHDRNRGHLSRAASMHITNTKLLRFCAKRCDPQIRDNHSRCARASRCTMVRMVYMAKPPLYFRSKRSIVDHAGDEADRCRLFGTISLVEQRHLLSAPQADQPR